MFLLRQKNYRERSRVVILRCPDMVMVSLLFVIFILKDFLSKEFLCIQVNSWFCLWKNKFGRQGLELFINVHMCTLISFFFFFCRWTILSQIVDNLGSYIENGFPVFFLSRTCEHILIEWYLNVFKLEIKYMWV